MGRKAVNVMWGVAPHSIDVHTGDGQETRRSHYNTSQSQYNGRNVNIIVMEQLNAPERSQNKHHKQNKNWHDRWSPHNIPNGPNSVSEFAFAEFVHILFMLLLELHLFTHNLDQE